MSLQITGALHFRGDTQQVSEKFKKREFIVAIVEDINGNVYTNYGKFQLVQNKCDVLDRFKEGDNVKVSFNIKGNKWEKDGKTNYITNLDAWRIEAAGGPQSTGQSNVSSTPSTGADTTFNPSPETVDDLPF